MDLAQVDGQRHVAPEVAAGQARFEGGHEVARRRLQRTQVDGAAADGRFDDVDQAANGAVFADGEVGAARWLQVLRPDAQVETPARVGSNARLKFFGHGQAKGRMDQAQAPVPVGTYLDL